MKKYYSAKVIMFFLSLLVGACIGVAHANDLPTIGVYKIDSNKPHISRLLTESMSADLAKMKSCNIVERDKLDQVFSEQALTYDGIVEALQGGSGQAIGLDYLLLGSSNSSVTKKYNKKYNTVSYYTKIVINLKLVDARSQIGKVVWSGQRSIESINDTGDLTDIALEIAYDMSRQLYEQKFPVAGYIIKAAKGQYYVDLGTEDGVSVKDKLEVESIGDVIIHPVTGEAIGTGGIAGKLKVTEVYEDYCIAVPDGEFGGQIKVKDKVIKKIKDKPKDWLGVGWSGKVVF